ncbi:MAG: hypothetical protein A2511_16995 [Deltaproteobacteria bacterium RIFOXYD12_FULL_50_9]|nr:MAG: hypothetical protein A2511_16995 [Deltaproteobacteria bacterium RIFOXYD12_FULL_50_9]
MRKKLHVFNVIFCLLTGLLTIFVTGCSSLERKVALFDKKYQGYINLSQIENILENPVSFNACIAEEVSDMAYSSKQLAENGYLLVGDTMFNDRKHYSVAVAKIHCGKIGAERALFNSQLVSSSQVIIPYSTPQVSYANTTYQGQLGNYIGSSTTSFTQYVQREIRYNVNTYRKWASYWVKAKPPTLGVYYDNMPDKSKYEAETNSGAYVYLVINDSPAFNSNIIIGDVITEVDEEKVIKPEDLTRVLQQKAGQDVVFSIIRKGKPIRIALKLNPAASK